MGVSMTCVAQNLTTASISVKRSLGETDKIPNHSPRHHLIVSLGIVWRSESVRGGLFTTRLREGSWNYWVCAGGSIKDFIEYSERFVEEICCTAQSDVNLFESFLPFFLLVEGLETAMLFIHDRLLRI